MENLNMKVAFKKNKMYNSKNLLINIKRWIMVKIS